MNPTLRYAAWMMILLTCVGNAMVLWGRFTSLHDENRSVSMVIRNLAVSDLIMGLYLIIISIQDVRYRESYHTVSAEWVKSWGCAVAGILSMVSSEVSILILTFMSIERFLLISDPFGHHRLNTKNVMMSLYIIWLVGLSIAIFPVILFHHSTKFYGIYNGGTCFPLFIHDKFPSGWEYSAFVFFGINLTLLILIATLYTALLFSIWRTRRATTLDFFDCEFAIRYRLVYSPSSFSFSTSFFPQIFLHRFNRFHMLGSNNHPQVLGIHRLRSVRGCVCMVGSFCSPTELRRQPSFVHVQYTEVSGSDLHNVQQTKLHQEARLKLTSRY